MAGNEAGKEKLTLKKKRKQADKTKHMDQDVDIAEPGLKKPKPLPKAFVGMSCKLNTRYKNLLQCLCDLIPGMKGNDNCPHRLDMERVEDSFFILASNHSKGVHVKLELLTAFGTDSKELDVKRPLIAFSHGFENGDSWKDLKQFLLEMFGQSDSLDDIADYLYAFTRIGGKFQLCIYKIHSMPDALKEHMQLEKMDVSFVLKPARIQCADNARDFRDKGKGVIKQEIDLLNLIPAKAYHDKSSMETIPHLVERLDLDCVMLPAPPDSTEWDGFNTTVSEFFDRYRAFDKRKVIGTGLSSDGEHKTREVEYYQLLRPFKVFGRSRIALVGETVYYQTTASRKSNWVISCSEGKHWQF